MSTATMQQTPAIPPRPSKSQEKDNSSSATPAIPPRPVKILKNRSISPNPDRFAPSPLNDSPFPQKSAGTKHHRFSSGNGGLTAEPIDRSSSTDLPTIGQEGQEYAAVIDKLASDADFGSSPDTQRQSYSSPETTRTIGEDIKLHAPKPTMPAQSAKQRVAQVTRTDSDRAAAFGIGRPTSEDPYPRSLKKKGSTTSQLSHHSEAFDDEQGIPEIGQRVPMYPNAGDVQAPSPAPGAIGTEERAKTPKYHVRKTSSRGGFESVPPGAYGLHGHHGQTAAPTDKLEKAYYEKHPELKTKEHYNHLHDRVKDFSMSSDELNKIVRESARGAGFGTSVHVSTPSEQVGFQAADEYTSRISSPCPPSAVPKESKETASSLLKKESFSGPEISVSDAQGDDVIHVDEPGRRKGFAKFGDEQSAVGDVADEGYDAPILAPDEVAKDPSPFEQQAAVEPIPEHRGSNYESEQPRSRPSSRPASIYSPVPGDMRSTPLEDVEEYEPLFPEDDKSGKKPPTAEKLKEIHHKFPSRDIWEDAPESVHGTAEVSTPEPTEVHNNPEDQVREIPPRDTETPAQAFARRQEELAESETENRNPDTLLHRKPRPPSWHEHQPHIAKEMYAARPNMTQRFPSRDIWEDTPESHKLETTVATPQQEDEPQSATTEAPPKPYIPPRPKKQNSGDDKPQIPDRPKPQIPARPSRPSAEPKEPAAVPKQKPAVPARPVGGKIAALQAGFMSDLNKRLQLGPREPKKDEPKEEDVTEVKEKAPLSDARKGRARGPQRRAPTKNPSPSAAPAVSDGKPVLSFSSTRVLFSIDEEGTMQVDGLGDESRKDEKSQPVGITTTKIEEDAPKEEESTNQTEEATSKPVKPEPTESNAEETVNKPVEPESTESKATETKTLATNIAGEAVLEEAVEKKQEGDQLEGVEATKDKVVS